MPVFRDAFISYGRPDSKAFAMKLKEHLAGAGLKVWLDLNDIPLGTDYQKQIDSGIDDAHNFLFIISPHSANSSYCQLEIEQALKRCKRIIPLMHKEEISQEVWQQRHPHGTAAEWEAYKLEGKHSSYPNLHPAIGKINWIFFREEIDHFEQSVNDLLSIFERDKSYVTQHTNILFRALEWERNQKRNHFLLVGEERKQAESWMLREFRNRQPPCYPTDLQCEFITESTKNSQNFMTQGILIFAEGDNLAMSQILKLLRRQGITVWSSKTDISVGQDLYQATKTGIEQADNAIFLLSSHSQASVRCQRELAYAISLKKRIIPLLVGSISPEILSPELRDLQHIDLTHNSTAGNIQLNQAQLIAALREEAAYHERHKQILVQALKWKRQNQNPAMLLGGYSLRHAKAWLKIAKLHATHQSLPLQEEFIKASLCQLPNLSLDVFIAYSRTDSDFARRLNEALQYQGKSTWFDQESITSGSDFQREIYQGIEHSKNIVFIISPNSIKSPYCADEVEHALKHNKRIITVLHRAINQAELHPGLKTIQWIDFYKRETDFTEQIQELLRVLDDDREHLELHTKLLVKAIEWESKGQEKSLFLRGSELEEAGEWLARSEESRVTPQPTASQRNFILLSGKHEIQEAQRWKQLYSEANTLRQRAEIAELKALNSLIEARLISNDQYGALVACLNVGFGFRNPTPSQTELLKSLCLLRKTLKIIQEKNITYLKN